MRSRLILLIILLSGAFGVGNGRAANQASRSQPGAMAETVRPWEAAEHTVRSGAAYTNREVPTLLDETGALAQPVSPVEAAGWQAELKRERKPARKARLHVWLGEYELAGRQEPVRAQAHFAAAKALARPEDAIYGLAAFDLALATFYHGDYERATRRFDQLLRRKVRLRGIDPLRCALWYRRAGACAGYHAERARLGIPQAQTLDPFCAASGVGVCLRELKLPYDRERVLRVCRVGGRGSNLLDVLEAARKLGLSARSLTLDEAGLRAVPKPLIAWVEHDHFVAVTAADNRGVSYSCSSCGSWPGGRVDVTWKQWRAMEATAYVSITRKGSADDQLLSLLQPYDQKDRSQLLARTGAVRLASAGQVGLGSLVDRAALKALLQRHVFLYPPLPRACTFTPNPLRPAYAATPKDAGAAHAGGPLGDDPVNLATGEDEYQATDLTVYNPKGPSVIWRRLYNSLRGPAKQYQADDFGIGWSHPYNISVYDPSIYNPTLVESGGVIVNVPITGTSPVPVGVSWVVVYGGSTVATSAATGGWYVALLTDGRIQVKAPAGTPGGTDYEVRCAYTVGTNRLFSSGIFDVTTASASTCTQGDAAIVPETGATAPATGTWWEVLQGGTTVATSSLPRGWIIDTSSTAGKIRMHVPLTATVGTGYEVRAKYGSTIRSGTFSVAAARYMVGPGTKYLLYPNGATVSLTAPSVPTAANPVVACSAGNGAPIQVQWLYVAGNPGGRYVVTTLDGTSWGTSVCAALRPGAGYNSSTAALGIYPLSLITDPLGNGLSFTYSASPSTMGLPLLAAIQNLSNGATLLTIDRAPDATSSVLSVSDVYGRSVYYHTRLLSSHSYSYYDGYGRVYQEVDQASQVVPTGTVSPVIRNSYNYALFANHAMLYTVSVPSPTGTGTSTATINYDYSNGFVTSVVDGNGNSVVYTEVDSNHTRVTMKNSAGVVASSYSVGFDSYLNETTRTDGTNTTVVSTKAYADPNTPYRPSSVTDGNGRVTYYSWDVFGQLQGTTTPRGTQTTIARNYSVFPFGRVTSVQEGVKAPTTYQYFEPSGLADTITSPAPGGSGTVTTSFTYDGLGNVLTVTGGGNNAASTMTTTFNYTTDGLYSQPAALGQALTVTNNLGQTSHFRYNNRGHVVSTWDALGNQSDATYNIAGQPLTVISPATGQTGPGRGYTEYTYLYPGGLPKTTSRYDESGIRVRQVTGLYGKEGELLSLSGDAQSRSFSYDSAYRILALVDGNNRTTAYSYHSAGYLASVTYPGGASTQYPLYDPAGNLLRRIDGRGWQTDLVYNDTGGKLSDIQYATAPLRNAHFTYDGYGRLTSATDATGSHSRTFGDLDELISSTTTYTGLAPVTLSYAYYPNGSRQSVTTPVGSFAYSYDGAGRLTGLTNPFTETSNWAYLTNGWLASQHLGNGAYTLYTDNAAGAQTGLANYTASSALLSAFGSMTYDGAGNRTQLTATFPGLSAYSGVTNFTYNNQSQLTEEQSARAGGYTFGYGYDGAGNPTTFRGAPRTYNWNNQDTANTYDNNGNPVTYSGTALSFDPENRLTQVGSLLTADYSASGLRAWKENPTGRTYFIYDGSAPLLELDGSGNLSAVNTWGAYGLVSRRTAGSSVFYTFDPQGSVAQRLDTAGTVLSSHLYDAFGLEQTTPTGVTDPYGFKGQWGYYTDRETGLQLLTLRYYDPGTGRFLTRDPSGYGGGLNLYAYCGGNPVNLCDPTGLSPWYDDLAAAGAYGAEIQKEAVLGTWASGPGGIAVATITNSAVDAVAGLASVPHAIGHLGEGLGAYSGDPTSSANQIAAWGDVGTICAIGLAGAEAAAARATPTAAAEEAGTTAEASAGGGCFPAGTPVATAEGERPIETVQPGDLVLTADPDTGTQSYQRVTRTFIRASDELFRIELADGRSVEATGEHPFWVEGKGFVLARYLARSDLLRDEDGHRVPVARITSRTGRFTVYNFEVEPTHTYYAAGWWVHNQCPGPYGDLTPAEIEQIQAATDAAGRPIHVVGSAAGGTRRGVGTDLPIGKGPGTRSDIDYLTTYSSADYWQDAWHKLPSVDPAHGPLKGNPNPFMGPSITFEPR